MNNITLTGRLTRDMELRHLEGGRAMARGTIAVDKSLTKEKREEMIAKGTPTADFINIVIWGKRAEALAQYTNKGSKIGVQGRLQTGSYKNQDGMTVYTTDVVVEDFEFLEPKNSSTKDKPNDFNNGIEGFAESDDEIPF